ncbi:MAG: sporulation protein YqfD, partial [Firmicutes bacterium]|nr:sporulation protein YqfD [Bacillota bacterium]
FINICLRRNIEIWDVSPKSAGAMTLKISKRDFKRIRSIRGKSEVKIKIRKKRGLYNFLKRYRKRYMFAVCALLCVWAVYAVSQHIWSIEINGVKNSDINTLAAQLAENGVVIGAKKKDLKSVGEIKKDIIIHNNDIAWLWIYFDGTKARVEVSETRVPSVETEEGEPCDITAVREGVIKDITVKSGEAQVKRGDAAEKGDVLISGKVAVYREGDPEEYMYVRSLGTVEAYTSHTAEREEKLYNEVRVPTGKSKRYFTLEIFGKQYNLYREKNVEYEDYDIQTECHELVLPIFQNIGIALTVEKNSEVTAERYPIDEETAVAAAKDKLEEEIANELTLFAELQSESVEYEKTDDETIKVRCTMGFTENIGAEEEIRSE